MSHSIRKRSILRGALAVALLATATTANAQKMKKYKLSHGSVKAIANGLFQVSVKPPRTNPRADTWVLKPQGVSQYLGTAPKEWLRPGMVVMVSGTFDNKGVASLPVASIQAFTPRPGRGVGVVVDPSGFNDPEDRNAQKSLLVSGPIQAIEDGNLIVALGKNKTFTVPMKEDAEVIIDLIGDLSWVKEGDSISGVAKYVQYGKGFGTELKVTGQKPLQPPPPTPLTKKELREKAMREKQAAAAAAKEANEANVAEEAEANDASAAEDTDGENADAEAAAADGAAVRCNVRIVA